MPLRQIADLETLALRLFEPRRRQPRVGERPLVHLERKLAVDLERRDLANRLRHPRVGRAIALLVDALLERRVTDEVFDDGATQLAAHVFRKLRCGKSV